MWNTYYRVGRLDFDLHDRLWLSNNLFPSIADLFAFKFPKDNIKYEWIVIFYTNTKIWSGTNREIYVILRDEFNTQSEPVNITPNKSQLESGSVDKFVFDLDTKLNTIKEITVGVAFSIKFFSDWNLKKVILSCLT